MKNGDIVEMKGFEMFDTDSLICNYLAMIYRQVDSIWRKMILSTLPHQKVLRLWKRSLV